MHAATDFAERLLSEHRTMVLAVAHALETYRTISGEDIAAIWPPRMSWMPGTEPL